MYLDVGALELQIDTYLLFHIVQCGLFDLLVKYSNFGITKVNQRGDEIFRLSICLIINLLNCVRVLRIVQVENGSLEHVGHQLVGLRGEQYFNFS